MYGCTNSRQSPDSSLGFHSAQDYPNKNIVMAEKEVSSRRVLIPVDGSENASKAFDCKWIIWLFDSFGIKYDGRSFDGDC